MDRPVRADSGTRSRGPPKSLRSRHPARRIRRLFGGPRLLDRQKAFEAGIPHGEYVYRKRYGDCPILSLLVTSELHTDTEYGGPFWIHVPSKIRVSDLRDYIRDRSGIMPGLMKLAYRGQSLDDESRKLEHYGVRYWNKKFPDWPLVIKR